MVPDVFLSHVFFLKTSWSNRNRMSVGRIPNLSNLSFKLQVVIHEVYLRCVFVCAVFYSRIDQSSLCVRDWMKAWREHWLAALQLFNLQHGHHYQSSSLLFFQADDASRMFCRGKSGKIWKTSLKDVFGLKNIFSYICLFRHVYALLGVEKFAPNAGVNTRIIFEPMSAHFPNPPPAPPPLLFFNFAVKHGQMTPETSTPPFCRVLTLLKTQPEVKTSSFLWIFQAWLKHVLTFSRTDFGVYPASWMHNLHSFESCTTQRCLSTVHVTAAGLSCDNTEPHAILDLGLQEGECHLAYTMERGS